jgi:hypothetical protein
MSTLGMTPEHFIYIPAIALLGLYIGYVFGSRAVRAEYERARKRMKD